MSKNRFASFVVAVVGAGVVAVLLQFNRSTTSYDHYLVGNFIALLFVPMLTVLFVLREDPDKFGFTLGSWNRIWVVLIVLFAGLLVAMAAASRWQVFQSYYPLFRRFDEFRPWFAHNYPENNPFVSAPMMMLYAQASYGLYMFCWEFFFRGYLLFGMLRSIGWPAVLVQAAAFGLLHLGKPVTEQVASYIAGVVLGMIALNAKSFVPCFALHWLASISFDLLVVANRPQ